LHGADPVFGCGVIKWSPVFLLFVNKRVGRYLYRGGFVPSFLNMEIYIIWIQTELE
jgi:hypothetical protein